MVSRILKLVFIVLFSVELFAAKYAGEFLNIGAGARALGMGGAFAAVADDGTAAYWNPAGLASLNDQSVMLMHSERFGGLINYDYLAYSRGNGSTALAASLFRTDVGKIKDTTNLEWYDTGSDGVFGEDGSGVPGDAGNDDYDPVTNPTGTEGNGEWDPGEELIYNEGRITYGSGVDWALYLTWAENISGTVSLGGSAKIIYRSLMDHTAYGVGFDLGFMWRPVETFSVGVNIQDSFSTQLFWDTGSKESILPTLKTGFALKWPLTRFSSSITFAADGDFRFEGIEYAAQYHFSGISLDTHLGMEFRIRELVALRLGSSEGNFTAGAGISFPLFQHPVSLDYAWLSHEDLDNTHRISLGVGF